MKPDCWCCDPKPTDEGLQETGANIVKHRTRGGKGVFARLTEKKPKKRKSGR